MFRWAEHSTIPEYTHEMLHYRNAMVKEINFVFSDSYAKVTSDDSLHKEFEKFKDFREKTANRISSDAVRNKVWLDLMMDIFKASLDFTAADLYIKYFNIPNDAINADFYFFMKSAGSVYEQLIKDKAFRSAFEFLHFYKISDALLEFEHLLSKAIETKSDAGLLHLLDNITEGPYDKLLKDDNTRKKLEKSYDQAEQDKKVPEARKIAEVLNDSDRKKRIAALDAMMSSKHNEAIDKIKEIRDKSGFKPIVKEYYSVVLNNAKSSNSMEHYKIAFSYAVCGNLGGNGDKRYIQEPAGKLFEHYVSKLDASEADFYEADKYKDDCDPKLVQDTVALKMLELVHKNDHGKAKHIKKRFVVEFNPGEYKAEEKIRKFFRNLTETYGQYDIPKGEENLLTALDISELFNFHKSEIEGVHVLLCKFYLMHKLFAKAKKHYLPNNRELYDLIVKQVNSFIKIRDFDGAYGVLDVIPLAYGRKEKDERTKEVIQLIEGDDTSFKDLETAIILDDIYDLKHLSNSFFHLSFEQGLNGGNAGIQFLVDMKIPFGKKINCCGKISLANTIKKLIAVDKISAELLAKSYEKYSHPDIIDYIFYFFKKMFGAC